MPCSTTTTCLLGSRNYVILSACGFYWQWSGFLEGLSEMIQQKEEKERDECRITIAGGSECRMPFRANYICMQIEGELYYRRTWANI